MIPTSSKLSNNYPYIQLASGSPRRQQLLTEFGVHFKVISHRVDETLFLPETFNSPQHYVKTLATEKAKQSDFSPNHWVLAADTIVVLDNRVLEKPLSVQEALQMLTALQGRSHTVFTGYCLFLPYKHTMYRRCCKTRVSFGKIDQDHLKAYIDTYQPFDKAGSYGLQELPDYFNYSISGSRHNVIGLPIRDILRLIKHIQS